MVLFCAATTTSPLRQVIPKHNGRFRTSANRFLWYLVKGVLQELIRDGSYVRNVERQFLDGFMKKYHGRGIPASRIREMKSIFGRTTLPENYIDAFSDKLARCYAAKELQEAAEETFWEQMDPSETTLPLQDNAGSLSPTRLMDDHEKIEVERIIADERAEQRKLKDVKHELSEVATKRPTTTNVSEVQGKEKHGLVAAGDSQITSKEGTAPHKPYRIRKPLSVSSLHPSAYRIELINQGAETV